VAGTHDRDNSTSAYTNLYAPMAIILFLSACILAFHLPGSFTQDSMFVLSEALGSKIGHFSEWLSPTYTLVWKMMISISAALWLPPFAQVSTMSVLQTVLIVAALVLLLREHGTWLKTVAASTAVISYPAIFVYFGEIWRDVLMAALLLVSVFFLDTFSRRESRTSFAAALCILFFAGLIRQNAIIAVLPLFFWAGLLCYRRATRKYHRAALFTAVLLFTFTGLWFVVNRLLASTSYGSGASSIMYYDLMGISDRTGELLLPAALTVPGYSIDTVRSRYQDEYNDLTGVILPANVDQMRIVSRAWWSAILTHPKAYLEHRWFVTLRFLGISRPSHLPYFYGIPESLYPSYFADRAYYVHFPSTNLRKWERNWLTDVEPWVFRQWIYGVLTAAVLFFNRRRLGTPFWLGVSGGAYWLSCSLTVPSTDFRYAWWTVLAVTTAMVLTLLVQLERTSLPVKAQNFST
jgi:hypothetical protein